ncbi:MAG: hypothetical protein J6R96_07705, partial [Spirochaetaceae bacterium]|nr:hypothetical protein [Spirochaetaceae bacterium]
EPGFLLEWDQKIINDAENPVEGVDYFMVSGIESWTDVPFVYKGPKPKDLDKVPNDAARTYIKTYMEQATYAMKNCTNNNGATESQDTDLDSQGHPYFFHKTTCIIEV